MNLTKLTRAEINSPSDLMQWAGHLESLGAKTTGMLFRGQPEQYNNLRPTLARSVQGAAYDAVMLLERRLLDSFRRQYMDLDPPPGDMPSSSDVAVKSSVEVLSLMQHYEVPSRLLDWTESVWVAAYFACASNPDKDADLWFADESILDLTPEDMPPDKVRQAVGASIGDRVCDYHPKWGMPFITVVDPLANARITAQRGKLTASDNAQVDHAKLLWRLATLKQNSEHTGYLFGRYIIRGRRKRDILAFLSEEKAVSAKSLFPDIVGLGRFVRWEFESLRTQLL